MLDFRSRLYMNKDIFEGVKKGRPPQYYGA